MVSWSSGKDSALTLHRLRSQGFEIAGLLTTFTDAYRRVSMHGVREKLAEMQAEAAGLPLMKAYIPPNC
ncbi:MAG: ATP-binding protein, partial [Candidatus Caldarchaeum sp.]|nr:ATP-binding protein [Candidatus Caldarchaeum sp.]